MKMFSALIIAPAIAGGTVLESRAAFPTIALKPVALGQLQSPTAQKTVPAGAPQRFARLQIVRQP
jgi:hypothetical protein